MHTRKVAYVETREVKTGYWDKIVTVEFLDQMSRAQEKMSLYKLLKHVYGTEGIRWNLRWTLLGADIRFHKENDYASFCLFYTVDKESMSPLESMYPK